MAVLLSTALFETDGKSRPFCGVPEVKESITRSKNYMLDRSDPATAVPLLIYQSRLQQTWLVKTARRLYCVLDDLRRGALHVNWSMPMSEVLDEQGRLKLALAVHDPAGEERTGKIDFGPKHKGWLFSSKLFTVRPVEEEIRLFLQSR